jgi:hypothetical protein
MKAIVVISVLLLAVFLVFAAIGSPRFESDGVTSYYSSGGLTIFDYWTEAESQQTQRARIAADEATALAAIEEEAATERHAIFWQMAPWVLLALTALAAVIGGVIAWIKNPPTVPLVAVTVNRLNVPDDVERFARQMAIDAEYQHDGASWWIVDRETKDKYQPPPHLARLPGPQS